MPHTWKFTMWIYLQILRCHLIQGILCRYLSTVHCCYLTGIAWAFLFIANCPKILAFSMLIICTLCFDTSPCQVWLHSNDIKFLLLFICVPNLFLPSILLLHIQNLHRIVFLKKGSQVHFVICMTRGGKANLKNLY